MHNKISDDDFVTRYCPPSKIYNNLPLSTAFLLRNHEECISVNRLPVDQDIESGLQYVRSVLEQKIHIKSNGKFIVLNVGHVKNYLRKSIDVNISIQYITLHNDPTHAGICLLNHDNAYEDKKRIQTIADALSIFVSENPSMVYSIPM